jgi:hypothetical protein
MKTEWKTSSDFLKAVYFTGTDIVCHDKVIPKIMEARNSQNTTLTKKKSGCRISIMGWA